MRYTNALFLTLDMPPISSQAPFLPSCCVAWTEPGLFQDGGCRLLLDWLLVVANDAGGVHWVWNVRVGAKVDAGCPGMHSWKVCTGYKIKWLPSPCNKKNWLVLWQAKKSCWCPDFTVRSFLKEYPSPLQNCTFHFSEHLCSGMFSLCL